MNSSNCTSIERFHKWKSSIRGSNDCILVGIDVAKEKHVAFFGTPRGEKILRRFSFKNNREGFEKLLIMTEEVRVRKGFQRVLFGLEPTACYHKPLAEYLIEQGYFVALVDAVTVKRNRETLDGRWDKNDPKDSANVADLLSQGKCIYYDHASEQIRELRSLLSLKRKLKKQEHSLRLRIRNHLITQYFPELDPFFNTLEEECLAIINHCFDPSVIASLEFKRFVEIVSPAYKSLKQQQRLR
ncbi:MAG: IS110 family transposase, partial [Gammaproteobacteria bacterium]|nr:IS110 family transposase [Gammaproteobacteria bacterium]